METHLLFFN